MQTKNMISHVPYVKAGHAVFTPSCPRIRPWDNLVQRPRPPSVRVSTVDLRTHAFPALVSVNVRILYALLQPLLRFGSAAPHPPAQNKSTINKHPPA